MSEDRGELVGEIRIRLHLGGPPTISVDKGIKVSEAKVASQWLSDYISAHRRRICCEDENPHKRAREYANELWQRRVDHRLEKALEAATEEVERPHACDWCSKRYKSESWLDRHVRTKHTAHFRLYPGTRATRVCCGKEVSYMGMIIDPYEPTRNDEPYCEDCVAAYEQALLGDLSTSEQPTEI